MEQQLQTSRRLCNDMQALLKTKRTDLEHVEAAKQKQHRCGLCRVIDSQFYI